MMHQSHSHAAILPPESLALVLGLAGFVFLAALAWRSRCVRVLLFCLVLSLPVLVAEPADQLCLNDLGCASGQGTPICCLLHLTAVAASPDFLASQDGFFLLPDLAESRLPHPSRNRVQPIRGPPARPFLH